jgi:5-methylcytosine-specific restriction endonuclease McrA
MVAVREFNRNQKVLLLNSGETVIDAIDWRQAVTLMITEKARQPWGHEDYYKIPVSIQTAERMRETCEFESLVEGTQGYILLPTAIVLVKFVHLPYKRAAVNKTNVLKRDKYTCAYCGKKLTNSTGTVDHVIPLSRWEEFVRKGKVKGKTANNWKNVVASCRNCNCKKDDKTPSEACMKIMSQPFVPSKDYLIFITINIDTMETWSRWICFDDLK